MNEFDKPPPALDAGRLLAYARMDEPVPDVNKTIVYVIGELLGRVTRLAIYESLNAGECALLLCNEGWSPLGVAVVSSFEEARKRAESDYRGVTDKWIDANVSAEEAARYLREQGQKESCSFCGRPPVEVRQMISSSKARICEQCIKEFFAECAPD